MSQDSVERALSYMLAQVGKPYVWGGTGPRGYDCSGLGYMGYKAGGISIPRVTGGQQYAGTAVHGTNVGVLLPGDAIFPHAGHVVWYLGGGRVVEAPKPGLNVRVTDLPSKIWKVRRYATAPQTAWTTQTLKAGFGFDDIGKALRDGTKQIGSGLENGADFLSGWTDNVPLVSEVGGAIGGGIDATQALIKLSAFIVNPNNWYRVGLFVLGGAFLFIAFRSVSVPAAGNVGVAAAGSKVGAKAIGKLADLKGAG